MLTKSGIDLILYKLREEIKEQNQIKPADREESIETGAYLEGLKTAIDIIETVQKNQANEDVQNN